MRSSRRRGREGSSFTTLQKFGRTKESVRARLRSTIKRLLARDNYPPDRQKEAIDLVLRQMEHFADEWSANGVPDD